MRGDNHLQGNGAVQLVLPRFVHDTHAAASNLGKQVVVADACRPGHRDTPGGWTVPSGYRGSKRRIDNRQRAPGSGQTVHVQMIDEKRRDLGSQNRIFQASGEDFVALLFPLVLLVGTVGVLFRVTLLGGHHSPSFSTESSSRKRLRARKRSPATACLLRCMSSATSANEQPSR